MNGVPADAAADCASVPAPATVTANCGNATAQTQNITVTDTTGSVLSGAPAAAIYTLSLHDALPILTASDACSGVNAAGVVLTTSTTAGSCAGNYILHRTWTATDNCRSEERRVGKDRRTDTTGPVLNGKAADAAAGCASVPAPAKVTG